MNTRLRNPLKQARGLGSAQTGVGHWWTQRVTAAALLLLVPWLVFTLLGLVHADFATAKQTLSRPWNAVLLIAFAIAVFWHAALGLQVVVEDYVHTRWKEIALQVLIKFFAALAALASVLAVLRIVLIP